MRDERLTELEEMISRGWGDMRQDQIPADWRSQPRRMLVSDFFRESPQAEEKRAGIDAATAALYNESLRHQQVMRKTGRPLGRKDSGPRHIKTQEFKEAEMRARYQRVIQARRKATA